MSSLAPAPHTSWEMITVGQGPHDGPSKDTAASVVSSSSLGHDPNRPPPSLARVLISSVLGSILEW